MKSNSITFLFAPIFLSLVAFSTANADPVSFNNVVALPNTSLASNPNILMVTPNLNFSLDIHGAGAQADSIQLQLSFQEQGLSALTQNFAVPIFDGLPDYTQVFNFHVQNPTFGGTPVTLTVNLVNTLSGAILQSQTYNFSVSQPIPEPATVSLLALSVVGLISRKKRR
ncbi:MAG TPA: PEP-CTERM sorting domain-containing protein [Pyrinomonadaceae bacterium]